LSINCGEIPEKILEQLRTLFQWAENGSKCTIEDIDKYNIAWEIKGWKCSFCQERYFTFEEAVKHERITYHMTM